MNRPAQTASSAHSKPQQSLTGFVLAGGKSSRMGKGRDKAFLDLAGQTLLERAITLLQSVAEEVLVVGEVTKFMNLTRSIEDIYPAQGPLGGIHAALRRTSTPLNLILAVDLPFVEPAFLAYLASEASRSGAMVTAPRTTEGWQPLCAVYHRDFADVAEPFLKVGKNKIDSLFSPAETRAIGKEELERTGFSETMFRNLNTPEEFARAEKELREAEEASTSRNS